MEKPIDLFKAIFEAEDSSEDEEEQEPAEAKLQPSSNAVPEEPNEPQRSEGVFLAYLQESSALGQQAAPLAAISCTYALICKWLITALPLGGHLLEFAISILFFNWPTSVSYRFYGTR